MAKSSYDEIAAEYYDLRHITSRNFDQATHVALKKHPFQFVDQGLVLELGAGRGRANEYLGVQPVRIVQLDNSPAMYALEQREPCLLQVIADACDIPFSSQQFSAVVGFLVDPFLGLNSLSEAFRMLKNNGQLFLTVPAYEWGIALRKKLGIDLMTTRFRIIGTENTIVLPSLLHTTTQLEAMLVATGFRNIEISEIGLPDQLSPISQDIAVVLETDPAVPIIRTIRAVR